jgi:hypothetical protein
MLSSVVFNLMLSVDMPHVVILNVVYAERRIFYDECHKANLLSVNLPSTIFLIDVITRVIMLWMVEMNMAIPSTVQLGVIMLSVVLLIVVAPLKLLDLQCLWM